MNLNIIKQIEQGESKTIEFKEKMPSNISIAKTVIAFSNTSGGKLIMGIRDDKEIVGINEKDIFDLQDKIISLIVDSCYPNILPEIYTINIEDKLILVIEIFRGNLLPYSLKNKGKIDSVYMRIGASNRLTDANMLAELQRQRVHRGFDEEENFEFDIKSLNLESIYSEFEKIGKHCDIDKLKNLKLVNNVNNQLLPTNALIIALGELANVSIKCARFKGSTMESFIDKKEFSGDLFTLIGKSIEFLQNHLNLNAHIVGLQRVEKYEIPLLALREIILNAIVHRDYTRNSDIKIAIYDDIVEIVSVGGLVNGLTIEDINSGRSELRNRVLANLFKELGFIESWGSGIQKVRKLCDEQEIGFEINEKGTFVEALFYRPISNRLASKNSEEVPNTTEYDRIRPNTTDSDRIIEYIMKNGRIKRAEANEFLDIKETRIKEIFNELIAKGLTKRVGLGRSTYYVLAKDGEVD